MHFGHPGMESHWPNVSQQFFDDLKYVIGDNPIDLIAITGDIANRGLDDEYDRAADFIVELKRHLEANGGAPVPIASVPGNHDVSRPSTTRAVQQVLEQLWNDDNERTLLTDATSEPATFVAEVFKPYSDWISALGSDHVPIEHTGALPGDYAGAIVTPAGRLGVLGLNGSYRQLSSFAKEGDLSLSTLQVQKAAGGNLPAWSRENVLTVVLTHHPTTWFRDGGETRDALFSGSTNIRLHLCGHLHTEQYDLKSVGAAGSHLVHQGQSLFGLEKVAGETDRQHGYAVLTVEIADDGSSTLSITPRSLTRTGSGIWQFDRSSSFGLPKGSDATAPQPLSGATATIAAAVAAAPPAPPPSAAPAAPEPYDSTDALKRFSAQLASGEMVAVIGDRAAGGAEPVFAGLRQSLWSSLGSIEADDRQTSIDDLLAASEPEATRALVAKLANPGQSTVAELRALLQAPFSSFVYLSPLADLEKAAELGNGQTIKVYNGLDSALQLPNPGEAFAVRLATQAHSDDGLRLAVDPLIQPTGVLADWVRYVQGTLARSPTVYIADTVNSLSMWRWVSARDATTKNYNRPAFLVCPDLAPQHSAALERYGVDWIKSSAADFIRDRLATSRKEFQVGRQARSALSTRRRDRPSLSLSELRTTAEQGSRDYLLGTAPTWGDVINGFAARLSFADRLAATVAAEPKNIVHVVGGTAGCGRTTAMMQVGLELQSKGHRVGWVDSASGRSASEVIAEILASDYDYLFIDDIDIYGAEVGRMLNELRGTKAAERGVVVGVRSVRAEVIDTEPWHQEFPVHDLSGPDVTKLLKVLGKHSAIANRRMSDAEAHDVLVRESNSQLLVGMMRITSGLPFNRKVEEECAALSDAQLRAYGVISVVSAEREAIGVDQLLTSVGGEANEAWRAVNGIRKQKLVHEHLDSRTYESRHRVVAEAVRDYLTKKKLLAPILRGTLRAFAASAAHIRDNADARRRTLVRLLNHSYLIDLSLKNEEIRSIYDAVEDLLEDDFQYWLQRGSFEVERGDTARALHDLRSAMTSDGGERDHKVLTEYSYLRLKIAFSSDSLEATKFGIEAIEDLLLVIRENGTRSPHTAVVLSRDGVAWLEKASLKRSELDRLARESIRLLDAVKRLDETNRQVARTRLTAIERLDKLVVP
jgi:Mrp family chromosome partitioning ATPase